jgi:TPR repeat protein
MRGRTSLARFDISSMRALARMYESGEGTNLDRVQALNWFLLAAERENQSAIADLNAFFDDR